MIVVRPVHPPLSVHDAMGLVTDAELAAAIATANGNAAGKVSKSGDTMTGPLTLPGNATGSLHATPLQQVQALIAALVNAAPGMLDTLNELAVALGNDPNFAATMTAALAAKADAAATTAALAGKQATISPGTYAGAEIAYAQSLVFTAASTGTPVDVPSASIVIPAGSRPVKVMWAGTIYNDTAAGVCRLDLVVDGTRVNGAQAKSVAAYDIHDVCKFHRLAASGSSRTAKLQVTLVSGATANVQAQVASQPCAIWAVEC